MGTLKIHSENILPIIKKSLYSDRDIFLRELISNSCDAMSKLKILRDQGEADVSDEELRIDIEIDKENKLIKIIDTGLGMTADEVEKYIAQLAFSGAEEFIEKYESKNETDQVIGHFGLGFYSSFMVSDKVEIQTRSYTDAPAAHWLCDGGAEYSLDEGTRETRGTEIHLHINEESLEYLEESKITEILTQYCKFLPYPIFVGKKQINEVSPLWIKPASECTDKEYLEFYRHLHPMEPDPIFWIHLNVDYPFNLKGILYFPKITKRFDFSKSTVQLYCNRVFVSDQCKDLIPDFLTILRGAIDSPDIPLNVSRSYLHMDKTVRQLASHISKKVSDKLVTLYQTDSEKFTTLWPDIEMIIKLGVMQDDKFYQRMKEALIWKTAKGEWKTLLDIADAKTVFYSQDLAENSPILQMYNDKNIDVLFADSYIDTSLLSFLESKESGLKFKRVDGSIDDQILDSSREKTVLDADGKTEGAHIADLFRTALKEKEVEIEAKSLASDSLPGFVMIDEDMRRMREMLSLSQQDPSQLMKGKQTFVVNTNHPLTESLLKLSQKDATLANEAIHQLFELSLLSQRELGPDELSTFINRSNSVLSQLAAKAT